MESEDTANTQVMVAEGTYKSGTALMKRSAHPTLHGVTTEGTTPEPGEEKTTDILIVVLKDLKL